MKIENKLTDCELQLKSQVDDIVRAIENCDYDFDKESSDYGEPCAADYLSDFLDVNYIIDSRKNYKGCRLLMAFGGPNIWIDTVKQEVQGFWGSDKYIVSYHYDELGIDDYIEELYNGF